MNGLLRDREKALAETRRLGRRALLTADLAKALLSLEELEELEEAARRQAEAASLEADWLENAEELLARLRTDLEAANEPGTEEQVSRLRLLRQQARREAKRARCSA